LRFFGFLKTQVSWKPMQRGLYLHPYRVLTPVCGRRYCFTNQKVKVPYVYIPPLTGKPEQQWVTIQSGVLTGTSSGWHGTIAGYPLPERMYFGPTDAAKYGGMPQPAALWQ